MKKETKIQNPDWAGFQPAPDCPYCIEVHLNIAMNPCIRRFDGGRTTWWYQCPRCLATHKHKTVSKTTARAVAASLTERLLASNE